jgi:excisionase family DNA binding protein
MEERMKSVITESQMKQSLEHVLRELARAIVQALPQHPREDAPNSQSHIESGVALPDGRLLVTMTEAAALLSISRAALYRVIADGQIRTIRIGKSRRVPISILQEFIAHALQESD